MKIPSSITTLLLSALLLCQPPADCTAADSSDRPGWWLENGICFAGHWEPLIFRVRRGPIPTGYLRRYEYEHSPEAVRGLKTAGVNMVITHFYKGLGMEYEAGELAYTEKLARHCRENGMKVGAYIGSTLFNETLYAEKPESRDWVQLDEKREPVNYSSSQYFRDRADCTLPGYREHIKGIVTTAIEDYGMDLIHFDNISSMFEFRAGTTENIRHRFREYLEQTYTAEERREILGFSELELITPPRLERGAMEPVYDPLAQEWTRFRVAALTDYVRELSEHIKALDPEVVMETNPLGLAGSNRAYTNGLYHPSLLEHTDIFWSEDPDHARYYPSENRLLSKIRSYKLARRFGNAMFSYSNNRLDLVEAMAFNLMCLGDVGFRIIRDTPEDMDLDDSYRYYYTPEDTLDDNDRAELSELIHFFHDNKKLFRGLETIADVGVMRDFESMTFGGWTPFLNTIQAEQVLIQNRVPFTLLFDRDWERLERWKVVVLASQENLSDHEIARLKEYVERGGALAVVGSTGTYDERRRQRGSRDSFSRLLGLGAAPAGKEKSLHVNLGAGRVFFLAGFTDHPSVRKSTAQVHPDNWYLPLNWEEFLEGLRWCGGGSFSMEIETRPHVVAAHYKQGKSLQCHLLNYWPERPVRHIPVVFDHQGGEPARVLLHTPGRAPVELTPGPYRGRWSVIVPELVLYSIVTID
ncbi:MAG: family 10 glycosylhydrolase [Candidatus Glassbacteria bacterium]|nr:family 10 glycosylhydrolase [Candidatus Glassbacteria bacterium]